MAKLSGPMVKALREVERGHVIAAGPTMAALKRRHLIAPIDRTGRDTRTVRLTPSGRDALAEIDRAEREAARQAEVAARPVPDMIGEPSARTAPPMPVDHEDEVDTIPARPGFNPDGSRMYESRPDTESRPDPDMVRKGVAIGLHGMSPAGVEALAQACERDGDAQGAALIREHAPRTLDTSSELAGHRACPDSHYGEPCPRVRESIPEVPQAWIDHLVTLLDAAVRIEHVGDGWYVVQRDRIRYGIDPERLDAAAGEAIRRGIAVRAGDRLALADSFRVKRAEARGIVEGAVVRYRLPMGGVAPGPHRWEILRMVGPDLKVCSVATGRTTWWPVERAELADRHEFRPNPLAGSVCTGTVRDGEGDAQNCSWPADHPIHTPPAQHVYKSHPYRSECRTAVQRGGQCEPCGKPAKDPIHR